MTVTILNGDVREVLRGLPADHFDMCLTSPPYWGLRSYLPDGHPDKAKEIGLEPTMQGYLETMVGVCREVWRVLKPEGTFWLNVGDSYNNRTKVRTSSHQPALNGFVDDNWAERAARGGVRMSINDGVLKEKDLCMIPNRLAILLQEDGWFVRSEIIWFKANPMPESVRDRPTCAHEKVWLLTKSARYFYDADAIREPLATSSISRLAQDVESQAGSTRANGGGKTNGAMKAVRTGGDKQRGHPRRHAGFNDRWDAMPKVEQMAFGANARNVWSIGSQPFSGAHFATMPEALAERCIKAGCPAGGTVLDPFGGAGTTGLVADRLGRHATLIELNPAYRDLAADRVRDDAPLFAGVETP